MSAPTAPAPVADRPAPAAARAETRARRAPYADRPAAVADGIKVVAWLSIAAGVIHAMAMFDHFSHSALYGVFFLALTYGQVLWGVALLRRPATDRMLRIGAIASLGVVAVWLLSRTVGLPFGPEAGRPEAVGVMDVAATFVQLVIAAYVAVILRPELRTVRGWRVLLGVHRIRIGMMLSTASVFAALLGGGHSH